MNTHTSHAAAAALIGTLLLGATACSSQQINDRTGTTGTDAPEAQAEPAAAAEPESASEGEAHDPGPEGPATSPIKQVAKNAGTREHPLPAGREVVEGDWIVTLGEAHDGWEEIHAEDPYNAPPEEGTEYWLVPVTLTYTGSDSAQPWLDLQFAFVGEDNRSYSDWCAAVVPEDLMAVDDLYTDATVDANVCLQVPAGAEGLWTVSTFWGEPTFFTGEER